MKNSLNLDSLKEEERIQLLVWAENVKAIQKDKSLTKKKKISRLIKLSNSNTFKSCSKLAMSYSKKYWKNASYAERLGIIGAGGALTLVGFGGAGIAALGGAIGVPLFLITAAGGTFIGTIIDKLNK